MRTSNVIIAVGVAGFLLSAIALVGIVGYVGVHQPKAMAPATKTSAKIWSREEFRAAVVGKSEREVIAKVGRPVSTQDSGGGNGQWYYEDRTRDSVTGNLDHHVQVVFQRGVVVRVNY